MFFHEKRGKNVILFKEEEYQKQSPGVVLQKSVPINVAKFTGKHLCQSLFFNKIAG